MMRMDNLYERSIFLLRFIADRDGWPPELLAVGEEGFAKARRNKGALEMGWRDLRKMAELLDSNDQQALASLLGTEFGYRWDTDSVDDLLVLEKLLRTGTINSTLEEAVAQSALEDEEERDEPDPARIQYLTDLIARWESDGT